MKEIILDIKDITDSREVMESKEAPKIRWFIYILSIAVAAAVIFACFFEVDEYTKITGEIRTQKASSTVTSSSDCKLKKICVDEGQQVKEGDVLFVLDSDYAKEQKDILQEKLDGYQCDLNNTQLLKKSIEDNKNYFKNDDTDSKYYYRYDQYKNGVLLSAKEFDKSQLNNDLTAKEKENDLESVKKNISEKQAQLTEYKRLLICIQNDTEYTGTNDAVNASYNEYITNYNKSELIYGQYKASYENIFEQYEIQNSQETVSYVQVETAKQNMDSAYSNMVSYSSAYMSDIRSQILLIENQLISDRENTQLKTALNDYKELKKSIEQGYGFNTNNSVLKEGYDKYTADYTALSNDYTSKTAEYQELYNEYTQQNSSTVITESNINDAKNAYESAQMELTVLKSTFLSQLQTKISSIEDEVKTLNDNKKTLELSLKGIEDTEGYEKLSKEKLKNEAVVTLNTEIDSLNENITSVKSQLAEVDQTIKNSEVKAACSGTITLVDTLSPGDIVRSGNQLCSIIPSEEELKVMLYIPENEISKIEIGQKTEYAFDAIPYNEYGKITGSITSISADSVAKESAGTKFYIAQADLSAVSLKNSKGNIREVKNGMLVEAKTISGSKKAIVWLLEKINLMD